MSASARLPLEVYIARSESVILFDFYHAFADDLLALVVEMVAEKDAGSPDKPDKKASRKE